MKPDTDPNISENVSMDLYRELVEDLNVKSKTSEKDSNTCQIDSGVSSPLPSEDTQYESTKYLPSRFSNCDRPPTNIIDSPIYTPVEYSPPPIIEDTKYEQKSQKKSLEICVSSDSEDDSGIQVLNEVSKDKSERTRPNLIDLATIASDSDCDSEIEHLPSFRKHTPVSFVEINIHTG